VRDAHVVGRPGQAEVGDLDPLDPVLQQDVRRLDVPVDEPGGVGGRQPAGDLRADPQDLGHRQRAGPVELLLEGLPGHVLHDQVRDRLVALGHLVDVDHVVVPDGRCRPGLAAEPGPGRATGGQLRGQHLDGDHPVQPVVEGPQDGAEPAPAEALEDLIPAQPAERPGPGGWLEVAEGVVGRWGGGGVGGEGVGVRGAADLLDGRLVQELARAVVSGQE
jgi:hypothetical protein